MKNALIFLVFLFLSALKISAQCEEPAADHTGPVLAARSFNAAASSETALTIEARTENSSWAVKESESAVLTVYVDGRYHQDVMLFAGAEKFAYPVMLGSLAPGRHDLKIVLNERRSAKNARRVKISRVTTGEAAGAGTPTLEKLALENAPFLYARPDTIDRFSDIPLLTYYEIIESREVLAKIRYTTIFTNEDGGTRTAALMARWGRATDIEWVYELDIRDGRAGEGIIQGANHVTKNFAGDYAFGRHPLIYDATVNNNFADRGCSPLRTLLLPVRADLSKKSRETVMDANPWIYRLMTEEALRENRIVPEKTSIDTIADPRDYLYAEVYSEPQNAALTVETESSDIGRMLSSDEGNSSMRVDRPGYVRVALRQSEWKRGRFPVSLVVRCHAVPNNSTKDSTAGGECRQVNLIKIVRLDEKFLTHEVKILSKPQNLKAGEYVKFAVNIGRKRRKIGKVMPAK